MSDLEIEQVVDEIEKSRRGMPHPMERGEARKPILDSGNRRQFDTGAVRDVAEHKGRWDLLPFQTLQDIAVHYERGCKKYGDRNWEKGIPLGEYLNSAMRHLWKWWLGHEDEDHMSAFVWNALCLMETSKRIKSGHLPKSLDNRPASLALTKPNEVLHHQV